MISAPGAGAGASVAQGPSAQGQSRAVPTPTVQALIHGVVPFGGTYIYTNAMFQAAMEHFDTNVLEPLQETLAGTITHDGTYPIQNKKTASITQKQNMIAGIDTIKGERPDIAQQCNGVFAQIYSYEKHASRLGSLNRKTW